MTTVQKITLGAILVAATVTIGYQHHQVSQLQQQNEAFVKQQGGDKVLIQQVEQLTKERDSVSNELASLREENDTLKKRPSEVLKLRGEVGSLQEQKARLGATTAISKMTATPEARQLLRDQQTAAMGMLYGKLAKDLKLSPEQTEKFKNFLGDSVMNNIDQITTALRDKPPEDQLNKIFADERASLEQNIQDSLGPDAAAQYRDYSKNMLGNLTVEQFKDSFTGSAEEKSAKADRLRLAIQQEAQSAVASAGLPADFQTVPILNLVNIASEQQGNTSVKLLQGIYDRVIAGAGSYLTPDEVTKFQAFTTKAIGNNVAALNMNRVLMAPIGNQ